ncbi:MAG: AAA family ATPase [Micropepsaceae bacterium]
MSKSSGLPTVVDTDAFGVPVSDRPVPRITIAAFCENPETGAVIQRAALDRRLSKTHVSVHMGGATAAAEHYGDSATPNLIIVESRNVERGPLMAELEGLASVCDPATKVVVVGGSNDIQLYRELIRNGISEYLMAPLHPMQVIETIAGLYAAPESEPIGKVFAFVGAKGGAGSSTIAHNFAWTLSGQLNIAATVVDLDLPFGTAGLDFNQDPAQGVVDALIAPERLDDVLLDRLLVKCAERLHLFAAPAMLDRDYDIDAAAFETVLDIVRASSPAVVIDVPHAWTSWSRQTLMGADEIIVTATPDLASLRNAKNIVDHFAASRPHDARPRLILNQVGVVKRPEIPVKDFAEAIGAEPLLVLPFDPQIFGTAANNGQMIGQLNAQSRAAQGFMHIARVLTGRESVVETKKPKRESILRMLSSLNRKPMKKAG